MLSESKKLKEMKEDKNYSQKLESLRVINTKIQEEGSKLIEEMKNANRVSN